MCIIDPLADLKILPDRVRVHRFEKRSDREYRVYIPVRRFGKVTLRRTVVPMGTSLTGPVFPARSVNRTSRQGSGR